jgi:hypothetical protein
MAAANVEENPDLIPDLVPDLDGAAEEQEELPPVAPPKPSVKKKIKVRALAPGFIHSERKQLLPEGHPHEWFEIHPHQLGKWMECQDPVEQRKHVAAQEAKRRRINAEAVRMDEEDRAAVE